MKINTSRRDQIGYFLRSEPVIYNNGTISGKETPSETIQTAKRYRNSSVGQTRFQMQMVTIKSRGAR